MFKFFLIIILTSLFIGASSKASMIDTDGPNELIVGKSFGFMLMGNEGFMSPGIENLSVMGCKIDFELDGGIYSHAIKKIYVSYDLSKANWNSAVYVPNYAEDFVQFEIYGGLGLRELSYDHSFDNEEELRLAVSFLGLSLGKSSDIKIRLPQYMTKERYDRAYLDLIEQCPGDSGRY